jgi:hypothetical protein
MEEARSMARDAMEGLIQVMLEKGESIPDSETADLVPRFNQLARTLHDEGETEPIFEQLSTKIGENV